MAVTRPASLLLSSVHFPRTHIWEYNQLYAVPSRFDAPNQRRSIVTPASLHAAIPSLKRASAASLTYAHARFPKAYELVPLSRTASRVSPGAEATPHRRRYALPGSKALHYPGPYEARHV